MGMVEYWSGSRHDYAFPTNVAFDSKLDTDLYEFAKVHNKYQLAIRVKYKINSIDLQAKTQVINVEFTRNGKLMAILSKDRKIRIFNVLSGKITETIDESLDVYSNIQQVSVSLDLSQKF